MNNSQDRINVKTFKKEQNAEKWRKKRGTQTFCILTTVGKCCFVRVFVLCLCYCIFDKVSVGFNSSHRAFLLAAGYFVFFSSILSFSLSLFLSRSPFPLSRRAFQLLFHHYQQYPFCRVTVVIINISVLLEWCFSLPLRWHQQNAFLYFVKFSHLCLCKFQHQKKTRINKHLYHDGVSLINAQSHTCSTCSKNLLMQT